MGPSRPPSDGSTSSSKNRQQSRGRPLPACLSACDGLLLVDTMEKKKKKRKRKRKRDDVDEQAAAQWCCGGPNFGNILFFEKIKYFFNTFIYLKLMQICERGWTERNVNTILSYKVCLLH